MSSKLWGMLSLAYPLSLGDLLTTTIKAMQEASDAFSANCRQ